MTSERRAGAISVRCACGWEWAGDVEAVVAATRDHSTRIHDATTTREEILAMVVDDGIVAAAADEDRPTPD